MRTFRLHGGQRSKDAGIDFPLIGKPLVAEVHGLARRRFVWLLQAYRGAAEVKQERDAMSPVGHGEGSAAHETAQDVLADMSKHGI
ncbi:MAG: hypothetical protein OXD40_05245 [bacterium]|nr:hypothetical protein [bacterium]